MLTYLAFGFNPEASARHLAPYKNYSKARVC